MYDYNLSHNTLTYHNFNISFKFLLTEKNAQQHEVIKVLIEFQGNNTDDLYDNTDSYILHCTFSLLAIVGLWIIGNGIDKLATLPESDSFTVFREATQKGTFPAISINETSWNTIQYETCGSL